MHATGAIFPLCRRSIAHPGVHSGRMADQNRRSWRDRTPIRPLSAFIPIGNGRSASFSIPPCPTIVPAQTAIVEDRVAGPATVTDTLGKGEGTRSICVDAAIRCEAVGTIRARKARAEAATATQNREAARDAAFGPRRAAAPVWLVWQQHLVMAACSRCGLVALSKRFPEVLMRWIYLGVIILFAAATIISRCRISRSLRCRSSASMLAYRSRCWSLSPIFWARRLAAASSRCCADPTKVRDAGSSASHNDVVGSLPATPAGCRPTNVKQTDFGSGELRGGDHSLVAERRVFVGTS